MRAFRCEVLCSARSTSSEVLRSAGSTVCTGSTNAPSVCPKVCAGATWCYVLSSVLPKSHVAPVCPKVSAPLLRVLGALAAPMARLGVPHVDVRHRHPATLG